VYEAEYGTVTSVSPIRRRVRVEEYLRLQSRYRHLFAGDGRPDIVARLQAKADDTIARFGLLGDGAAETADELPASAAGSVGASAR
jgi:pyruvate ferredoxin oxidoreductase beta subunit